jgi:hypothetical protein
MSSGVILDLIHKIDYSYCLCGDITIVSSWIGQVSNVDIESGDLVETIIQIWRGAIGQIYLDYHRSELHWTIEISSESGVIHADFINNIQQSDTNRNESYNYSLASFLSLIRSGEPFDNDLGEVRMVLEIALELKHISL